MEELQAYWDKLEEEAPLKIDREALNAMVSRKSINELEKFRNTLYIEYAISLLIIPLCIVEIVFSPAYRPLFYLLIPLCGLLCLFYHHTIRQYKKISPSDELSAYLENALRFMRAYVRQYIWLCWLAGISGCLFTFFADYWLPAHTFEGTSNFWDGQGLRIFWTLLTVIFAAGFSHYYIKYLYGARINKLQELLDELKES